MILLLSLLALSIAIICFQQAVISDKRKEFRTLLDDAVAVTKGYYRATTKLNSRRQRLMERAYRKQLKMQYKRDHSMRNFAEREAVAYNWPFISNPYKIIKPADVRARLAIVRRNVQRANILAQLP